MNKCSFFAIETADGKGHAIDLARINWFTVDDCNLIIEMREHCGGSYEEIYVLESKEKAKKTFEEIKLSINILFVYNPEEKRLLIEYCKED